MSGTEQYTTPITFTKYAEGTLSPEVRARLENIEATENLLWALPDSMTIMRRLSELQLQFNTRLEIDIDAKQILGDPIEPQPASRLMSQLALFHHLSGSSDTPQAWKSMQFDLKRLEGQYDFTKPEEVGLLEAAFYINVNSLGTGINLEAITISPETLQAFEEIGKIPLAPKDLSLYD